MYSKVKIIFGSTTGNTEGLVKYISNFLKESNVKVSCKDSSSFANEKIKLQSDIFYIFATSSWGVEPATLQEDFEIFYNNINKETIACKTFAILGCGDSYYPHFCGALDLIEKDILANKGKLLLKALKVQDDWEDRKDEIKSWAQQLVKALNKLPA